MKFVVALKIFLGFLALLLAAVGLLLPVWPTTPFVLVSIGCFAGTPKLRSKILRIPFIREYYESYTAGKGISRKTVAASLTFLWVMLVFSMILSAKIWITFILLAVGAAVTVHILLISNRSRK